MSSQFTHAHTRTPPLICFFSVRIFLVIHQHIIPLWFDPSVEKKLSAEYEINVKGVEKGFDVFEWSCANQVKISSLRPLAWCLLFQIFLGQYSIFSFFRYIFCRLPPVTVSHNTKMPHSHKYTPIIPIFFKSSEPVCHLPPAICRFVLFTFSVCAVCRMRWWLRWFFNRDCYNMIGSLYNLLTVFFIFILIWLPFIRHHIYILY